MFPVINVTTMKTYSEEEAADLIIQAFKNGKVQGRKEVTDKGANIVYDIAYDAGLIEGKRELTEITHRNYEATKRRGLITSETTQLNFIHKLHEETRELYESDTSDWSELADVALVCFAMAEHYGIDLIEEMRKKTKFNETRP